MLASADFVETSQTALTTPLCSMCHCNMFASSPCCVRVVVECLSDIIYPAGGEAVLRDGEVVGHVRHVSYSHQRKQFLMYAYLPALPGTSFHDREVNSKDRTASHFEIERLGKRHAVHGLPS